MPPQKAPSSFVADDTPSSFIPEQSAAPTGILRPLTERERFLDPNLYPVGQNGEGVGENLYNLAQRAGVGVFQLANAIANPRQTISGMEASVLPEPIVKQANRVVDLVNQLPGMKYLTTRLPEGTENPLAQAYGAAITSRGPMELIEKAAPLAGQALAGEAFGAAIPEVTGDVANAAAKTKDNLGRNFGSAPRTVRELVKKVKKMNEEIDKSNAEIPGKRAEYEHNLQLVEAENQAKLDKYATAKKEADERNAIAAREHEQATQVVDAENAAKMDKHRADVESVVADNAKARAQYEADKSKAEGLKTAAKQQDTYKGRLSRKIQENGQRLLRRIKEVQTKWKDSSALQKTKGYKPVGILDRAYAQIREATRGATVPPDQVANAVKTAESKITGSTENLKIFRDILSKNPEADPEFVEVPKDTGKGTYQIPKGHPLYDVYRQMGTEGAKPISFRDLQGYYSELGRSLSKGNLPDDVYLSLRSLQTDIGNMMQQMADERGVGSLLKRTQAQYRDYMQTFREATGPNHSGSPIADALNAKDPAYALQPLLRDETAARVRNSLSRFDKDLGGSASIFDNLRAQTRIFDGLEKIKVPKVPALPSEKEMPAAPTLKERPSPPSKSEGPAYPSLKDKPEPPPEPAPRKTVGEKEIKEAKGEHLGHAVASAQQHVFWWSTVWPAFRLISDALRGELPGATAFTPMVGGLVVNRMLDTMFQKPAVIEFFSRATPKDIAQVPPELRGEMPMLIESAKKRGIEVSPALVRAFVVSSAMSGKQQ